MSYENLFIGDFSDDDKNKIFLKEPLEPNSIKFVNDGFTIKLENGVELIHVENGIVIRVVQGKETPMRADAEISEIGGIRHTCPVCGETMEYEHNYCYNCGQKLGWEEIK
jgi:predicted RNA-binding Zn-ribbon protein involved in translation (DUF1610 family)